MTLLASLISTVEREPVPDALLRLGIQWLVGRTRRKLGATADGADAWFAEAMRDLPIATNVEDANSQHYEVPARFFELVLGPRLKYSSGLYHEPSSTLPDAEVAALEETVAHAGLADGQRILELGSGWGSLSLHMAETFPSAQVTAVSNSHSQRAHVEAQASHRGLQNVRVITADMNDVAFEAGSFDRVVSVEMFEHMSNWRALLDRIRGWLASDGRLFIHVFTHRTGRVPVRPCRQGRLDRAALLHRRDHAQSRSGRSVPGPVRRRRHVALGRTPLRAHRRRLATTHGCKPCRSRCGHACDIRC